MIENIKNIKVDIGWLDSEVSLDIAPSDINNNSNNNNKIETYNGILIYGKNGSGKTTISNSFLCNSCDKNVCFECEQGLQKSVVNFFDKDNNCMDDTSFKDNVFVYNEKFIEKNVAFKSEDGLDAIVMFGEQVDKNKEIENLIKDKNILEIALEDKKKFLTECNNPKSDKSVEYYLERIKEKIKESGWVIRQEEIKGLENNPTRANVTPDVVNDVITTNCSEQNIEELKVEYDNIKNAILESGNLSNISEKQIDIINLDTNIETKIKENLSLKIFNNAQLADDIKNIVNEKGSNFYEEIRKEIQDNNITKCPYCFQNISDEYKKSLMLAIDNILNKDVKQHIQELERIKNSFYNITELLENIKVFNNIDENLVKDTENKLLKYIQSVDKIKKQIEMKINNVYNPIEYESVNLNNLIQEINDNIVKINILKTKARETILKRKESVARLKLINNILASSATKIYAEIYFKNKLNKDKTNTEINELKEKITKIDDRIKILKSEMAHTEVAVDEINRSLQYIFFDKSRLQIENCNGKYYTKVNNKNVKLKNLSTGEKNVISLSYFFVTLLENENVRDKFKKEMLLVIDDPISSFDMDNKVGIYSFIREEFFKLNNGNKNTKIILMTHNLEVFNNIEDVFDDLGIKCFKYELKNNSLIPIKKRVKNIYTKLLIDIYEFALEKNTYEKEAYIGNSMRKVLEAFGTFNYNKGISKISTNELILSKIDDSQIREKFRNLMYRLVLHSESHTEKLSKRFPEDDFFNHIDIEEKVKTAKYLLVFLFLIDRVHIIIQLGKECEDDINKWYKEMLN